jgi:hypothetical protein
MEPCILRGFKVWFKDAVNTTTGGIQVTMETDILASGSNVGATTVE